jgi:hypothetical protein
MCGYRVLFQRLLEKSEGANVSTSALFAESLRPHGRPSCFVPPPFGIVSQGARNSLGPFCSREEIE